MPVNPVAENVFGTIGTVCWCIQLVPQAWKSWREKTTFGLSPLLLFIWASSALPLGVYNIALNVNIPLILQPQLFGSLAAVCWIQCLYYDRHYSRFRSLLIFFVYWGIFAGLEVGFVFAVRHGLAENDERPLQFFGVLTAILIFGGLFPQFYEIWKLKQVVGISMTFMLIDLLGGLFSTLSLAFKQSIDPLLAFSYVSVIVLDSLIILIKLILNPMTERRRAREAAAVEALPSTVPEETTEKPADTEPQTLRGPYSRPHTPRPRGSEEGIPMEGMMDILPPRSSDVQEAEVVATDNGARTTSTVPSS